MKKILLLFLFSFTLLSCENSEPISCHLPSTTITSSSPVVSGDNITLTSTETIYGAIYEWTGPNGFQSSEQNPVLTNSTSAMAGEYRLKVKKGICESEFVSTNVEIIVNTVTCTPTNNTGVFTDLAYPVDLYSVSIGSTDGKFVLYGSGSNTEVKITFSNSNTPPVGVYSIVPNTSVLSTNQVFVALKRGDIFSSITYNAKSGDVLISRDSFGNLYAIFCDVPFYLSTNTSPSNYGTVKITNQ